jgi:mono/diheme cytochrome c family protein
MRLLHNILPFFLVLIMMFTACTDSNQQRKEQFITSGLLLYRKRCQNCHGADGKGLGKLYPPLANSDYLLKNPEKAICGIKYGFVEKITVNGKLYEMAMPANADLKDVEVAQLLTYIANSWGSQSNLVEVDSVKRILEQCQKP